MDESCNGELVGPHQCDPVEIDPAVVVRSIDPPHATLPMTGVNTTTVTGLGLMLLVTGLVLVLLVKRFAKLAR